MLAKLDSLHQDVSQAIIQLRELQRYENDFTAAKKAELQTKINRLVGDAQRKMDTIEDHRDHGAWESSGE
jgi:uncharacterized protein YoxC